MTDGAAAVLMMTRREAMNRQLPILGIFRSFAAVGVDPAIMGVGPAVAIPEAVKQAGLTIDDIDLFELNEAFASQVQHFTDHAELCICGCNPICACRPDNNALSQHVLCSAVVLYMCCHLKCTAACAKMLLLPIWT